MPIQSTKFIWMNGELTPWESATVHVMSHALHYGSSIFEGVRAYDTPRGAAIFRLQPHLRRFYDSAKIYRMELPYSQADLTRASHELLRANDLKSAYLRPLAWRGYGTLGVNPLGSPVETIKSNTFFFFSKTHMRCSAIPTTISLFLVATAGMGVAGKVCGATANSISAISRRGSGRSGRKAMAASRACLA